jgi:hypothetical protein
LELQEGEKVSKNKVEGLMKKHPPWFAFDFHPIRFTKKLSEEEEKIEKEINEVMGEEKEV